jgi:UDP-2-acetamido-3-amino-2,3-dideoxy-glucuronate N-acetyltransferase
MVQTHSSATVSADAVIGAGTRIWHEAQVCSGARIGRDCTLGKGVYIDRDVVIGDRVKVQNRVSIFRGSTLGSGVFVGPHTALLNDRLPRAVTPDGTLKHAGDWRVAGVTVDDGASIGGGCTVLPGIHVGRWAMIGAGSVVTRDVEPHALVFGNPARLRGHVCECAALLLPSGACSACGAAHEIRMAD